MTEIMVSDCRIQYPYTESVCDQGFKRRVYVDSSKNEDTWYRMLRHCYAEYDSTLRSRKLRGVVMWVAYCT